MKKVGLWLLSAALAASAALLPVVGSAAAANAGTQTYTVVVGAEDANHGVDLEAFFPATLTIHVGDRVHWIQNSNEIHTVTFLAGASMPALIVPAPANAGSPVMLNPQAAFPAGPANGQYNGSGYANSGLMGMEPGQAREWTLTFTQPGTYEYLCLVHGQMMSGKVVVLAASLPAMTPVEAQVEAQHEMAALWAQVPGVEKAANDSITPASRNADGTLTHYVSIGYAQGQIDLMAFFPSHIVVHPGDRVVWTPSSTDMAPHTVTFVNGQPDPQMIVVQPQPAGPPLLLLNPAILMPQQAGMPLTRDGVYNSGLIDPTMPGPHSYTLTIGDIRGRIDYDCALHDANGMVGYFIVASRHPKSDQ